MTARTIQTIRWCLGLAALLVALPTLAGEVYQWKDAKGVTHYSDSPPPDTAYKKTRTADAPPAPEAKAEDPRCTIARSNLEKLKDPTKGPIGLDADGDGKPDKEMTPEEIANHIELAQKTVTNTCTPTAK